MNIGRVATHFNANEFEYLDPVTRQWVDGFSGRLAASDRFLSNFNRPTRKRMLYTAFDLDLHDYDVVRLKTTGEVYLLGVSRKDTLWMDKVTQLTICHMVTPDLSAGIAAIDRPAVLGTGDDLGWVVMQPAGETYLDLELRTTAAEPGSKETQIGHYFGFAEARIDLRDGDRLTLNGVTYVADEVAYDSGLRLLRLVNRDVHYVDMVFTIGSGTKTYDRTTGQYTTVPSTRNVSGILTDLHNSDDGFSKDSADYTEVRIELDHIGFEPKPNMVVELNGKSYTISYVQQAEYRRQWIVRMK